MEDVVSVVLNVCKTWALNTALKNVAKAGSVLSSNSNG